MNCNEIRAGVGRRDRAPRVMAWVACALALAGGVTARAQDESGAAQGQGRNAEDEDQKNPVASPATRAGRMPGSEKLQDAPLGAEPRRPLTRMEQILKAPPAVVRGELAPIPQVSAAQPAGGGGQSGLKPTPKSTKSFLKLVLKVKADGTSELLSATEMAGEPPLSEEMIGDYVYEVADGDQTLSTEALPDPFASHSFGGPQDEKDGHFELRSAEATIVVTVPGRSLASPMNKLSVRLYKLKPGSVPGRLNPSALKQLKAASQLEPAVVTVAPQKLAAEIRRVGVKRSE